MSNNPLNPLVPLALLLAILASGSLIGQEGLQGSVRGRVVNIATSDPLSNARIIVESTGERVLTSADGSYVIFLPAGTHHLSASYAGLDTARKQVSIAAGESTRVDFELDSEVYRLDEVVVRTAREDDALALQQQRYSQNIKTVVSTGAFGAPADNPGELLQRLPGISTGMEQGEVGSISIRGMGQDFAKLTVDGQSVATSFGNLLGTGRDFIVTELATNHLSQVELIKAPTPDQDADTIAGTVNLVTRRYYDRPGRSVQFNATVSGLERNVRETPNRSKFGRYGRTSLSYSDVYGLFGEEKNFGASLDLAWSRILRVAENTGPQVAGNLGLSYIDPSGANPLQRLFGTGEWGGPIEKFNANINFDLRLRDKGHLFLKGSFTQQDRNISRSFVLTANTPTAASGFEPGSDLTRARILPGANVGLITRALNSLRSSEMIVVSAGGEYEILDGATTLSFLGSYSKAVSKNPHFLAASAEVRGIGFEIDRSSSDADRPRFEQTAGPSWSEPGNYRATTLTNTITDGAPTDNYTVKLDLTHRFAGLKGAYLKTGVKYNDRISKDRRLSEQWTFVGADGVPNTADDSLSPIGGEVFRIGEVAYGPFPFLPLATSKEGIAPASHWKKTAAQAYNELVAAHARGTEIVEGAFAGYLMGNLEFGPKLRILAGARAERTEVETYSWVRNATAAWGGNSVGGASMDPAVVAANIDRALRSYVGQQRLKSDYTDVFPGAHVIWEPKDGFIVRGSYNRSIARPPVGQLLPSGTVNDEAMVITIGNPELKPYLSDNFELSVERYFEPVGIFSLGVFRKNITRYFRTFSDTIGSEGIDGSGLYAGYQRNTARNIGSAEIEGVEVAVQQQFRSLPGWLSGLGAFGNFTYLRAEGDFGSEDVTTRIPNMTPRTLNLGLTYVGKGWQIRPMFNWQDRTYRGSSGGADYDSESRSRLDLKIQHALNKKYSLELAVFNLTDQPDDTLVSSEEGLPFVRINAGIAYSVGITGRF